MHRIEHTDKEIIQILVDCMLAEKSKLSLQDMSHLINIARAVERSVAEKYTTPKRALRFRKTHPSPPFSYK